MRNRIVRCIGVIVGIGCAVAAQQAPAPARGGGAQAGRSRRCGCRGAQQAHGNLHAGDARGALPRLECCLHCAGRSDQVPPADDPSTSPNPLNSAYPGWEAVGTQATRLPKAPTC